MGVEAWLYHHLRRPKLVAGTTTNGFERASIPDWIEVDFSVARIRRRTLGTILKALRFDVSNLLMQAAQRSPMLHYALLRASLARSPAYAAVRSKLLLQGGCDTDVIAHFLAAEGFAAATEKGNWRQTLESLRFPEALSLLTRSDLARALRWSGDLGLPQFPNVQGLFGGRQLVVLSLARDYKAGFYRYRDTALHLPIPPFDLDLTDPSTWTEVLSWRERFGFVSGPWHAPVYSPRGLAWLRDNCRPLPAAERRARVLDNVRWCTERIAPGVKLILLTVPEIAPANIYPMWRGIPGEAAWFNEHVDRLVTPFPNVRTLRVQNVVTSHRDLCDGHPYHYRRSVYMQLARAIIDMRAEWLDHTFDHPLTDVAAGG
jgi:hypothetical protein